MLIAPPNQSAPPQVQPVQSPVCSNESRIACSTKSETNACVCASHKQVIQIRDSRVEPRRSRDSRLSGGRKPYLEEDGRGDANVGRTSSHDFNRDFLRDFLIVRSPRLQRNGVLLVAVQILQSLVLWAIISRFFCLVTSSFLALN